MKKLISLLLVMVLCIPMLCVNADAASDYTVKFKRAYGGGYTNVTMTCANGEIYYTTDGTVPDKTDKHYTGKFKVTKPTTLRVAVYDNGKVKKRYKAFIAVKLQMPTAKQSETYDEGYVYSVTAKNQADIYYTTNGTTPHANNGTKVKNGKIYAKAGATLTIRAVKDGWKSSSVRVIEVPLLDREIENADFVEQVVELVNKERAAYGLSALKVKNDLHKAANTRAHEITQVFSHNRPDGSSCYTVLEEYGLNYGYRGENIAAGYRSPEEVVDGWMQSEGHRANILNPEFNYIGVGCVNADDIYGLYWVQIFQS